MKSLNWRKKLTMDNKLVLMGLTASSKWLYFGVLSGFLSGFLYFVYGVYIHGNTIGVGPYNGSSYQNHYHNPLELER